METAPIKTLKLRFTEQGELAVIDEELKLLSFFADYYEADHETLGATIASRSVSRLSKYGASLPEPVTDITLIEGLVGGEAIAYNESEQRLINLKDAMTWLDKQNKPLSLAMLQNAHKMLLSATPKAHTGGTLRTDGKDLFAYIESGELKPAADELKAYLGDVSTLLENDKIHPVSRAFLLYYVLHAVQPFTEENDTMAILATHTFLRQKKYDIMGLLNLEEHVFFNEKFKLHTAHIFDEHNYLELLGMDLSTYLETCIHRYHANVQEAKQVIIGVVKELFGYPDYTPRQKNSLNFWLNQGFFIQHQKLHQLTARQHDIMMLLLKFGSVTNKDLVTIFQVDRKTLQRDFTALLDLGLLEQRGMGRAVRYHIEFRV